MLRTFKQRAIRLSACILLCNPYLVAESRAQNTPDADDQASLEKTLSLLEALNAASLFNPSLRSEELRVLQAKGNRMIDRGPFDTNLAVTLSQDNVQMPLTPAEINENYPYTSPVLRTHTTDLKFTINKLLHNGVTLTGSADASRIVDNETQIGGVDLATFMTGFTMPLLQGRGRPIVNAASDAAQLEESAVNDDTGQFLQQILISTAQAYWSLAAAHELTRIAQAAEERGQRYVEDLKAYIAANRVPANDLNQALANLDSRSSDLAGQEQNTLTQQEQLKLLTGISSQTGYQILVATDTLPTPSEANYPRPTARTIELLYRHALENRKEYQAATKRVSEAERLLKAARQAVLPVLNANIQAGYSGLSSGRGAADFLKAAGLEIPGPTAVGALSYSRPVGNDAAYGKRLQASTSLRQSQLAQDVVRQQIEADVVTAANLLYALGKQLQFSYDATAALEKSLSGEEIKFRAGLTSVTDLLLLEDRLTNAYQQEIQVRLEYADAIMNLNLATGDLSCLSNLPPGHLDPTAFLSPRYLQ